MSLRRRALCTLAVSEVRRTLPDLYNIIICDADIHKAVDVIWVGDAERNRRPIWSRSAPWAKKVEG